MASSSAIEYVLRTKADKKCRVLFHFIQSDNEETLGETKLFSSLIRQLLDQIVTEEMNLEIEALLEKLGHYPSPSDLLALFSTILHDVDYVYIFLDGLDENQVQDKSATFKSLAKLLRGHSTNKLKLYLAGRGSLRPDIERHFQHIEINIDKKGNNEDIRSFIDGQVEDMIDGGDFFVQDPTLIEDIKTALSDGAQGM